MSQLEIQILHQDYLLTCPDGHEAQLMEAVERVDQQFQQMRDTSKLRSRERIGVLLAVNLAYENLELRSQLQALQQQVASIQNPVDSAQADMDFERLATLEAQAVIDQQAATALLQRLDQVLADPASATDAHIDFAATACVDTAASVDEVVLEDVNEAMTDVATDLPSAEITGVYSAINTDLENTQDVSLATAGSENL